MTESAKDLSIGAVGLFGTISLGQFNQLIACGVGLLTLACLGFRLCREIRNRNNPPTD